MNKFCFKLLQTRMICFSNVAVIFHRSNQLISLLVQEADDWSMEAKNDASASRLAARFHSSPDQFL